MALSRAVLAAVAVLGLAAAPAACAAAGESYTGIDAKSNGNVLEQSSAFAGITVTRVVENSPAEAAGIREGDVLLRANGIELAHPDRLAAIAAKLPPGSRVRLRIERDRRVIERELVTVARIAVPPPEPSAVAATPPAPTADVRIERRRLGIEFRSADPARLRALPDAPRGGVELTALASRSPLLEAGLRPGDILLELNNVPIPSADDLLGFLAGLGETTQLDLVALDTAGARRELAVQTYRAPRQLRSLALPPLLRIERMPAVSRYSFLLGAVRVERFETGSRYRLLYFWRLETGAPDTLEPANG
jgi:S1-C subfamily serine protease